MNNKMITTSNIEQAKREIRSQKEKSIIVKAHDDNFNRKILEYGKFNVLLSPEIGNRKDSIRQLDSGLNHVLAKIAVKNNIAIGIDISEIKKLTKQEKGEKLARIKQNINICRKAKAKIKVINSEDKRNALSFLITLGASTKQAKEAIS